MLPVCALHTLVLLVLSMNVVFRYRVIVILPRYIACCTSARHTICNIMVHGGTGSMPGS